METYNQQSKQHSRNSILLQQRNKQRTNNKRQTTLSKATSIIAIAVSVCQTPSGSHALVISRGRSHASFGVAPSLSSSSTSTISMKENGPKSTSSTILHYRNYRVTDGGYSSGNSSTSSSSSRRIRRISQGHGSSGRDNQHQASSFITGPEHHKDHDNHQISSFFHTLWTSGKSRRASELYAMQMKEEEDKQKQQCVLDDYLESIDRRYKRLHEEKNGSSSSSQKGSTDGGGGGFTSALQWLTQQSSDSTSSQAEEMRKQEDAIYVLGLADLASTRLLQRHHLPIPKSKLNKSVVIDIGFKSDNNTVDSPLTSGLSHDTSRTIMSSKTTVPTRPVALNKAVLILQLLRKVNLAGVKKWMEQSSQNANQIALNILKHTGKVLTQGLGSVVSFLTATSGLKHSLQMLSVLAVSLVTFAMSLIRPITKA